jgi:hypothetical protein
MPDIHKHVEVAGAQARYKMGGCHLCRGKHDTTVRFFLIGGSVRGICEDCYEKSPRKRIIAQTWFGNPKKGGKS